MQPTQSTGPVSQSTFLSQLPTWSRGSSNFPTQHSHIPSLKCCQIMPFILQWSAHSTRQQTFWYNKITGWAQNKQNVKWGKYWGCKTSFALDIQKPLARHYSVQIQLLELSTAIGTILKAQKQKCSKNRQWLCSCPCSALCSVHWTHQPHLHVCTVVTTYLTS
jgi:hypothetical protein